MKVKYMWIVRKALETGINGISQEIKNLYNIETKGEYVSINDEIEIPQPDGSVKKIQVFRHAGFVEV